MLEDASLVILNVFLLQILFHETNPSGLGIDIHAYVFSNTVSLSRSYSKFGKQFKKILCGVSNTGKFDSTVSLTLIVKESELVGTFITNIPDRKTLIRKYFCTGIQGPDM